MGLIKKAAELTIPTTVKMMVYGQAGFGKTTLALSAPKPLLLDFDNGVKRVNLSHLEGVDIVQVSSWQDVQMVMQEDLSAYQTIVVDTIGKMMDFIITAKCGSAHPKIQDWGRINQEFKWFIRTLSMLNKNTVFVAHRDVRKEGDDNVFIPALREKNYNDIVTELDLLGYMEVKTIDGQRMRTITFDPTQRNDCKNTCNLPSTMYVPCIIDQQGNSTNQNNFIEDKIIRPYIGMLNEKKNLSAKYNELISEIESGVEEITDATSANYFIAHINDYDHTGNSLAKARDLFAHKVKALNLVYDKTSKSYQDAV